MVLVGCFYNEVGPEWDGSTDEIMTVCMSEWYELALDDTRGTNGMQAAYL
jgi:hypothetical protein